MANCVEHLWPGWSIGHSNSERAGVFRIPVPVQVIFPVTIQTSLEAHTTYRTKMCTVSLCRGVKRSGRGIDHLSPPFLLNFITLHAPLLWSNSTCIVVNFYILSSTIYIFHLQFWFLIYRVIFTH